jgi:hypothetical protein
MNKGTWMTKLYVFLFFVFYALVMTVGQKPEKTMANSQRLDVKEKVALEKNFIEFNKW